MIGIAHFEQDTRLVALSPSPKFIHKEEIVVIYYDILVVDNRRTFCQCFVRQSTLPNRAETPSSSIHTKFAREYRTHECHRGRVRHAVSDD